jgi:hypothetical protein
MRKDAGCDHLMTPEPVPRVSVVLPVRDAEAFLPEVIAQMQAQTLSDYEVVVVDDASTDGSAKLLADWAASDSRVSVLTCPEHGGVAAARNRGVRACRADLVWFADADDRWSSRALEVLVAEAERTGADMVLCNALATRADTGGAVEISNGHGPALLDGTRALAMLLDQTVQAHLWNKLFRRELLLRTPFPGTRAFSDLAAMGQLLVRAGTIARVDDTLYTYVVRRGSLLNSRSSRPRDLLDCRDQLRSAVEEADGGPELRAELLRFEVAIVYLGIVNDSVRRRAQDPSARAEALAALSPAVLRSLLRDGHLRLALVAALARWATPAYELVYRLYRKHKWGSVGYW